MNEHHSPCGLWYKVNHISFCLWLKWNFLLFVTLQRSELTVTRLLKVQIHLHRYKFLHPVGWEGTSELCAADKQRQALAGSCCRGDLEYSRGHGGQGSPSHLWWMGWNASKHRTAGVASSCTVRVRWGKEDKRYPSDDLWPLVCLKK